MGMRWPGWEGTEGPGRAPRLSWFLSPGCHEAGGAEGVLEAGGTISEPGSVPLRRACSGYPLLRSQPRGSSSHPFSLGHHSHPLLREAARGLTSPLRGGHKIQLMSEMDSKGRCPGRALCPGLSPGCVSRKHLPSGCAHLTVPQATQTEQIPAKIGF